MLDFDNFNRHAIVRFDRQFHVYSSKEKALECKENLSKSPDEYRYEFLDKSHVGQQWKTPDEPECDCSACKNRDVFTKFMKSLNDVQGRRFRDLIHNKRYDMLWEMEIDIQHQL